MGIKIFLDINIVVDFFDPVRIGHSNAKKLFSEIENHEVSGFVSESVLNTTVYVLRKQFSPSVLREILKDFLNLVELIPCSSEAYFNSLKLEGNDIEDALLYHLAVINKLDYFITEDKKDFRKISTADLPILTTKDFLHLYL